MTKRMTKTPTLLRTIFSLLMIITFLAMPNIGIAAPLKPQSFGPSSYLPMLNKNECHGKRPADMPFGVQLYGSTGDSQPYANELQRSFSSWVRNDLYWSAVEPENVEPSQYKWSASDSLVRAANDNCMNMLMTIDGTPTWAQVSHIHGPFKSELLPEFVQFVEAVVERYDGDNFQDAPGSPVVNYWEFYNEPDGGPSQHGEGWGTQGARYAAMLEAIYPVVKRANPNAKVVMGGIAFDGFTTHEGVFVPEFLENVLKAGGGDYFDIMNFHYYPFNGNRIVWTKTDSSGLIEKTKRIKEILAENEVSKPIILTETGWHSNNINRVPSSLEYQARYVVELFTQALSEDIEMVIWWRFRYGSDYAYDSALLTQTYETKLAFTVFQEAVRRLGHATNIEVVVPATETNDLEVYRSRMADTNKVQYIAWLNPIAPFGASSEEAFNQIAHLTQNWQAPGNKASVYSKDGVLLKTITDEADGANDNLVTVTVGRSPIYIVID